MAPVPHALETGSGDAVVLLHAFPLNAAMWLAQRESLGSGYRVVTPDQRGFGGTPLGDDPPSLDLVADDVAALLDDRGIETCVLGGLSMGGYVAMAFWRRHPHRVRALVLADTKAAADSADAAANRNRIAETVESTGSAQVLLDELLPKLVGDTTHAERPLVFGRVLAFVEQAPVAAVAWAQRAMAARPDSLADLRTVDVPTLVVVGAEDAISPQADAQAMVHAVRGSRLVVLPRSGHLSAVETPEAFTDAVAEFLASL